MACARAQRDNSVRIASRVADGVASARGVEQQERPQPGGRCAARSDAVHVQDGPDTLSIRAHVVVRRVTCARGAQSTRARYDVYTFVKHEVSLEAGMEYLKQACTFLPLNFILHVALAEAYEQLKDSSQVKALLEGLAQAQLVHMEHIQARLDEYTRLASDPTANLDHMNPTSDKHAILQLQDEHNQLCVHLIRFSRRSDVRCAVCLGAQLTYTRPGTERCPVVL